MKNTSPNGFVVVVRMIEKYPAVYGPFNTATEADEWWQVQWKTGLFQAPYVVRPLIGVDTQLPLMEVEETFPQRMRRKYGSAE